MRKKQNSSDYDYLLQVTSSDGGSNVCTKGMLYDLPTLSEHSAVGCTIQQIDLTRYTAKPNQLGLFSLYDLCLALFLISAEN